MTKELVDEKVTRHDDCRDAIPTPCGRGSGCVSEASYNHRGGVHCEEGAARRSNPLSECEKLFRKHALALLSLSFRNNISHTNHSGKSQSQLNDKNLTSYRLNVLTTSKKAAFTLAEVLVTLAVIGIVAVMTIPNMVSNYQKRAWDTASEVFDKKLTEALKVMNVQGTLAGYSSTEDFVTELSKHLKITKTCDNSNLTACFSDKVYWGENKEEVDISKLKTAKDFGQEENSEKWGANTKIVGFQLASGVTGLMAYNTKCTQNEYDTRVTGSDCLAILYDVQGYSKPNTESKDLRKNGNVLSLGKKAACDVEFGGSCWTISAVDTPMTFEECTGGVGSPGTATPAGEEAQKLGIKQCHYSNDYWAGAVKKCGHVNNMPKMEQLAKLVDEIYGVSGTVEMMTYTDLTIADQDLFDTFTTRSSYSDRFTVWSGQEYSSYGAYYRYFYTTRSYYYYYGNNDRNYSYGLAVCLSD